MDFPEIKYFIEWPVFFIGVSSLCGWLYGLWQTGFKVKKPSFWLAIVGGFATCSFAWYQAASDSKDNSKLHDEINAVPAQCVQGFEKQLKPKLTFVEDSLQEGIENGEYYYLMDVELATKGSKPKGLLFAISSTNIISIEAYKIDSSAGISWEGGNSDIGFYYLIHYPDNGTYRMKIKSKTKDTSRPAVFIT